MLSPVGMHNQQRRAAKAKQRHRRGPTVPPEREDPFASRAAQHLVRDEASALLQAWSRIVAFGSVDRIRFEVTRELLHRNPEVLAVVEDQLVDELWARVAQAWEAGWEPRDLVHAARRNAGTGTYVAELVVTEARASGALIRAPQHWRDQVDELDSAALQPPVRWRPVRDVTGLAAQTKAWTGLLLLLKLLAEVVPLEPIGPTPSQWGRPTAAPSSSPTDRGRLLNRIRGLLAKAEATDHPAEAETFTAKAQELMTRHAVEEAVLRGHQHEEVPVASRRVHLQAPYAVVKAALLDAVARPNRCRTVLLEGSDIAVLVGTPLDVDQTELLFTSLLIQATRAMAEAGHRRAGSFDRSATFRRSFLISYATRIGERLEEANRSTTATYGVDLVPLLQREGAAVTAEFERQFPHTTSLGSGYLDGRGWEAGRTAADRATLVANRGRLPATSSP
jgi:hypothetical protein